MEQELLYETNPYKQAVYDIYQSYRDSSTLSTFAPQSKDMVEGLFGDSRQLEHNSGYSIYTYKPEDLEGLFDTTGQYADTFDPNQVVFDDTTKQDQYKKLVQEFGMGTNYAKTLVDTGKLDLQYNQIAENYNTYPTIFTQEPDVKRTLTLEQFFPQQTTEEQLPQQTSEGSDTVAENNTTDTVAENNSDLPNLDNTKISNPDTVYTGSVSSPTVDTIDPDTTGTIITEPDEKELDVAGTSTVGDDVKIADEPEAKDAVTYDPTKVESSVREALQGTTRPYTQVSPEAAGFTPPPEGSLTTQALETFHNPTTGEVVVVPTGGYTAPDGFVKGAPEGLFTDEGLMAATKQDLSKEIEAAGMTADELSSLGLDAAQIKNAREVADIGNIELTDDQLVEAATLANSGLDLPTAIAQVTDKEFIADPAKFDTATPEAKAATEYTLPDLEGAKGKVTKKELVEGLDSDIEADQAKNQQSEYQSDLEGVKSKVGEGETPDAQDYYTLSPTDAAEMLDTTVQKAADGELKEGEAEESLYDATVKGATTKVGEEELLNAIEQGLQIDEDIEAPVVILKELDKAAVAEAALGGLSQFLVTPDQGRVRAKDTVQGQMSDLMAQFEDGTPTWAAGAIRAANAAMAARGLGGSSMAGAAIVQAAMEAAIPIAQADAETYAEMNMTNLDIRHQTALANAAANQNIELQNLSYRQQVALQNSANAFTLQMQNLSNQQQVVIANAQLRAGVAEKNLDVRTQVAVANAARYAEVNNLNLTNRQQARLVSSAQNLDIELANLSNGQQMALANLQTAASYAGQVLSNEQQMAVLQSQNDFETARFNATAEQEAIIQDAMARAALEGRAMDIRSQTALFNAARYAQVNDISVNNAQQALMQKSAENLQVDLANLNNRQQTELANATVRFALQGKILDSQQQAQIINASRYAEVNNLNLSNKQQALIQDFAARAGLEGQVLDNRQNAEIFNIANQIQERGIELTNEQQTTLFNTTNKLNVEIENLSNKQQTALANAQIDAALTGQELSNTQQQNVLNAARISEIANIEFNADQQKAIENARIASTTDLANLDAANAKVLADAASLSNMDMANLNNRQQAAVENARNFLSLDLANLSNEQQTVIFEAQALQQALLSDQAAENAALQFNAASENQVDQFFAELSANVKKFNADQMNAVSQFDANAENATEQFNTAQANAYKQFLTSNALIVSQSNAAWRQTAETANTAAQNEANMLVAQTLNAITTAALDEIWQRERDQMDYVFSSFQNDQDRANALVLQKIAGDSSIDAVKLRAEIEADASFSEAVFDWLDDWI